MKKTRRIPILRYPAVFQSAKEGGFDVSFPDLPGCVTFGKTFEEAREKAKEVLALWLEELSANNTAIPFRSAPPIIDEISTLAPRRAKLSHEIAYR